MARMTDTAFTEADTDRFSKWLRERSEPAWSNATDHRFVRELGSDTIDDDVFQRYLVQDYAFLGAGVSVMGYAVGQAPTMDAKSRLVDFLGTMTDDEDDYFERSFNALNVPADDRTDPTLTSTTQAFIDLLYRASLDGDYEETLGVLVPLEWIYLVWAQSIDGGSERGYLDEWIDLHDNPGFEEYVGWLRDELDRCGPDLSPRRQHCVERLFARTVELEAAFFDAAYER
jgi:thiaminase/transcriptional activator TenA